jgi:hypothetical protein
MKFPLKTVLEIREMCATEGKEFTPTQLAEKFEEWMPGAEVVNDPDCDLNSENLTFFVRLLLKNMVETGRIEGFLETVDDPLKMFIIKEHLKEIEKEGLE